MHRIIALSIMLTSVVKLFAQTALREHGAREHNEAACVLVETLHHTKPRQRSLGSASLLLRDQSGHNVFERR